MLRYRIQPKNPQAHLFEVTLDVPVPDPTGQAFRLPAWILGSYLIRDFSKHVVSIRGESEEREVALTKTDKSTWIADPCAAPLRITWRCTHTT